MGNHAMSMPRIDLRKAPLARESRAFGAWISLGHSSIAEIFAASQVDFVAIDMEHSTISLDQSLQIMAATQAGGAACFPRIASHNGEMIKRLLDSGADGIIVPMVNTSDEVRQIIDWCKYPPIGRRSYGIARGQNYGFDFASYTSEWNARSSIIIQIESIDAVNNIDELLKYDSINGVMIGPYDMSGSLGIPGQIHDPRVTEACNKVVEACRRHGKACATQVIEINGDSIQQAFDAGFTFIVLSSDVFILWKWGEQVRKVAGSFR
jgi:2-keto-3-deoxy-L-rhamnonate aldolase RhmA